MQALRDEIDRMRQQLSLLNTTTTAPASVSVNSVTTNHTTNNHTTNNNNTIVFINDFGNENLSYMQSPDKLLPLRRNGVFKAINQIHFNDEHMENQNVRLKSLKNSLVEVVEGGQWTPRCMTTVTEQMIQKAFKVITHKYLTDEEYRKQIDAANGDGLVEWVTKMWSMGRDKMSVMVPIKKDVQALLVSKRTSFQSKPEIAIA